MASTAPITGTSTDAPSFHSFDLSQMDDVSADLDVIASLVDVTIDLAGQPHGQNLLHAAIAFIERANGRVSDIHRELMAIRATGR